MNKIKELAAITVMALAILLITGVVKAEQTKSVTPQEFVESVASVPGKVGDHINQEIEKTKAYQAKSWAEAKAQWQRLISKFQAN
tara:strand:- start:522 stop:776 length:255 start_codon:yes stop_codon:yes gene_type:complete